MATNNELDPKHPACRNVETQVENIEDCLRRLQTDYIDIFRPMFNQEGKHEDHDIEVCIEAFEKAHKQGKVRWLGMSCHNRAFIQHLIEKYPQYSVVIFPYTAKSKVNFTDIKSIDPKQVFERGTADRVGWWRSSEKTFTRNSNISVFQTVQKHDIGVITIKPFGGGSLFRTKPVFGEKNDSTEQDYERARLTLAYILCNPAISATIPGMTTVEEVDNNVRASAELQALLDQKGIRKLREATEQMWANLPTDYQWLREWEWV